MAIGVQHRVAGTLGHVAGRWPMPLASLGVALLALAGIHHDTVASIGATWASSETYAHGWIILPISAWAAFNARSRLQALAPRTWWWGLLSVAAVDLLHAAATIAGVAFAQHLAVIALIPATVLVLLGPRVAQALLFPLGYLVFAVPWGEGFVPLLQDITAWMSVTLLELTGIPVFWEGRLISIPVADFRVAEACSGVRYVIASLALGALYAYLAYRSTWRRMAFMLAALLVPIVANGLRAFGIIMIAHWSDLRLATGVDHLIYGWIFFGLVMLALFWLGSFWRENPQQETAERPAASPATAPARSGIARPASALVTVIAIGMLGALSPSWTAQAQPRMETRVALPAAPAGWSREAVERPAWLAGFEGADDIAHARYVAADGQPVDLVAVHYRTERQGAELINHANRLTGGPWQWLGGGRSRVGAGDAKLSIREIRLRKQSDQVLLWTWYDIGRWRTERAAVAKAIAALLRMTAQRGDATLVAVATPYADLPRSARARLNAFLDARPSVVEPRGLLAEP